MKKKIPTWPKLSVGWLRPLCFLTLAPCWDDLIHQRCAVCVCMLACVRVVFWCFLLVMLNTNYWDQRSFLFVFFPGSGFSPWPQPILPLRRCVLITADFVTPRRSRSTGRAAVHLQRPDVRAGGPLAPLPGALRTHVVRALRVHRGAVQHQPQHPAEDANIGVESFTGVVIGTFA